VSLHIFDNLIWSKKDWVNYPALKKSSSHSKYRSSLYDEKIFQYDITSLPQEDKKKQKNS